MTIFSRLSGAAATIFLIGLFGMIPAQAEQSSPGEASAGSPGMTQGITDRPTAQRDLPVGGVRTDTLDSDDDGDGIPTSSETGMEALDDDDDGDGIPAAAGMKAKEKANKTSCSRSSGDCDDSDDDARPDAPANNHNTTRSNRLQPSVLDPDSDGDGIGDATEEDAGAQNHNSSRSNRHEPAMMDADSDGDGIGDATEEDAGAQNHNSSRSNRHEPMEAESEDEDSSDEQAGQNPAQRMMQNRPPQPGPTMAPRPPKPPVSGGMKR